MCYHCHSSTAPSYVADMLLKKQSQIRNTRSSSYTMPLLHWPAHSKTTHGVRSFSFASSVCISIPNYVRCVPSLSSYKSRLMTCLFCSFYNDWTFSLIAVHPAGLLGTLPSPLYGTRCRRWCSLLNFLSSWVWLWTAVWANSGRDAVSAALRIGHHSRTEDVFHVSLAQEHIVEKMPMFLPWMHTNCSLSMFPLEEFIGKGEMVLSS